MERASAMQGIAAKTVQSKSARGTATATESVTPSLANVHASKDFMGGRA